MSRLLFILAGVQGALAVGFGAFGAHWVRSRLDGQVDAISRMGWWETAAHYHLVHAVALGVLAALSGRVTGGWVTASAVGFVGGTLVFCGTLYAMALGAPRWFGAITPIGGTMLLAAWLGLSVAAWRL